VQQKENSEFWNPTCVIGGNKKKIKTSTKKIRIFYAPRFFSGQTRKKSAQIMRVNTVIHESRIRWTVKALEATLSKKYSVVTHLIDKKKKGLNRIECREIKGN
jgi:hypothetical protein